MTRPDLFEFTDFRAFLKVAFGGEGRRSGLRTMAAKAMGCQLAYLSQILRDDALMSLEQAMGLAEFLKMTPDERDLFFLMVQADRAGSQGLKDYFADQIARVRSKRNSIKNRLDAVDALGSDDAAVYYGSWIYACLHVMAAVPELRTRESMAARLGVSVETVSGPLDFLESRGLLERTKDGSYRVGPRHVHLPDSSPNIRKHHANWRLRALASLDREARPSEAHYAVVVSLSKADAQAIKERILKLIEETMKIVQPSPEETVYACAIDWFEAP